MSAQTFHEYDWPVDRTTHWHELRDEVRAGAKLVNKREQLTCPGCADWLRRRTREKPELH